LFPATFISAIIFFFVNMQESGIFTDALTKMNNRRKAIEYIEDQIKEIGESHPMYLYMGDINSFKAINDEYGHLEGDQALIIVAEVLKETAARHDAFAARYGGDEFIMCWIPEEYSEASAGEARGIITEIGKGLEQRCIKNRKPYTLSMGIGYVRCVDPNTSLAEYLKTADKDLYKNKAAMKAAMAAA
jgi:diguanylate cyclase (GGDEF)-like protein